MNAINSSAIAAVATTAPVFFFDSHGGLWATVAPEAAGAVAFGPTGSAREASIEEVGLETGRGTAWARAQAAGRLVQDEDGWDRLAPAGAQVPPRPLGRADWTDLLASAPKAEASAVRALDLARRAAVEARVGEGTSLLARLVDADDRVVLAFVEAARRKEPASAGATRAVREAARALWDLTLEALRAKEAAAIAALRRVTGLGDDVALYFLRRKAEARGFLEESEAAAWAASALRRAEVLAARPVKEEVVQLRIPLSGMNEWVLPGVQGSDPDAVEDALEFERTHRKDGLLRQVAREVYLQWEAAGLPLVEAELETEGFEDCDGEDWVWVSGIRLTLYSLKTGDIVAEKVERF